MESQPITYNPFTPGYFADPYPHYAELRAHNPAHFTRFGFLLLCGQSHVLEAYEHPKLSRDPRGWDGFAESRRDSVDGPLECMMANWLAMIDPPRHTALRAAHERAFTADLMTGATGAITAIVADLLDSALSDGGMDVVGQFADKLPVYLINHLLGLPVEDSDRFVAWSRAIAQTAELHNTLKVLQAGRDALQGMYDYLGPLVDARRAHPGDDLLSALAGPTAGGETMTRQEVLDSLIFLYKAGHLTTTNLITLGVLTLLRNPRQWDRLQADRSLLPNAIEEIQRYDGPTQMTDRVATEDVEICGLPVRRGQLIRLCLGAVNRDPARHPDPDRFDIDRPSPQHFGFGHGVHFCVAAALGRLQTRVALAALLDRAPKLRLTDAKLRYLPSVSNRGLVALFVEF
ncbi:MAG TPA: cytochrome P450 [Candidatus Limnocylindrales bacterium]|nr:cytochrome P450 [Candidatus Limnocylindrales bacterium]